jgi:hypothetical protein
MSLALKSNSLSLLDSFLSCLSKEYGTSFEIKFQKQVKFWQNLQKKLIFRFLDLLILPIIN